MTQGSRRLSLPFAERRARRAAVEDIDEILAAAAKFLEARSRSVAEVRRRLTSAGYRPALVEEAITRLIEQGYLDDEQFARAWVESRDRARPRGERALRLELTQKGIARQTIDAVLAERAAHAAPEGVLAAEHDATTGDVASVDELAAHRLLERHRRALLREADPRKRRQRAYALLARSGFDPDTSRTVAASVGDLDEADGSEAPATEAP